MLDRIIRFSLNNRLLVIIAAVLLMAAGIYTMQTMDVDVFPDLNAPTVVVMTEAGGMAPEEVEKLVTFPIETSVNGATGVRRVRSSSTTGFSVVWVEFDWGTDIYLARQIVSEKLSEVGENLPPQAGKPTMGPQSSILGEMYIMGLTSEGETTMEDLRTIADWTIRPRLLSMGGVAQVSVLGGDVREYQVLLNPHKMRHYGVTLDQALAATNGMNANSTGGILYQYGNEYIIRGVLSTTDTDMMGKTVVSVDGDRPVLLSDVARIKTGPKAPKTGLASVRGKEAVILTVTKQPETSTRKLTDRIDAAIDDLRPTIPSDIRISTDIFRQQLFIDSSIGNIKEALLEGAIFVIFVLFIFLLNARTTIISLVSIPLSLLISILTLKAFGLTINTMSIGGMAIAIGSLVDDAIVDVENVYKRLRANRLKPEGERLSIKDCVFHASSEVRTPILNSTFIIVASFVPLFFLSGMEGRMLKPLGIAFITSLFASTCVALTLTPVLCSLLLGNEKKEHVEREPFLVKFLKGWYEKALAWALRHKNGVLAGTGVLLVATILVYTTLGHDFLPPFNEGSFTINVSSMPGISLEESDAIGRQAEKLILTVPEIQTVARKTGRAELDEHALGVNTSEMEAPFVLGKRSKSEVVAELRQKLATLPGANVEIGQPISHRIDAMLSGTESSIAMKLFGTDLNRMYEIGTQIKEAVKDVEGLVDLNVEQQIERPQLQIVPRRDMLANYGVTPAEFTEMVEVYLEGAAVSQVFEGNRVFDLTVKMDEDFRGDMDAIRDMPVDTPRGKVSFSQLAELRSAAGPNTINRENVSRKIVISANVAGRDLRGVVDEISEIVGSQIEMPEGYHIEYGGQFESEESASRTLFITMIMALFVIFLLIFNQFKDVRQSVVVLLNLPLALIGGVLAVALTGGVMSIPSIIGFISLFGIATRNGMLLIDRYNVLREQGRDKMLAVLEGSIDRLNPILMTALTSALALIPLAIGGHLPGNEIQSPMAKVMLGGLLTSTLLNAFVIPIMYLIFDTHGKKDNI